MEGEGGWHGYTTRRAPAADAADARCSAAVKGRGWGERYIHYWLILPALLAMCAVLIYPLVYSLWISFFDWNVSSAEKPFIGLRNYAEAFTSSSSQFIFAQNIAFMVICIALEFLLGMALALLMSRKFVGRSLARTLLLLPMLTAPVLAGFNFRWIFNDRFGLANQLLLKLGMQPQSPGWPMPTWPGSTIVIVTIWQGIPLMMLLLLAGLESLPEAPFEAATSTARPPGSVSSHLATPLRPSSSWRWPCG